MRNIIYFLMLPFYTLQRIIKALWYKKALPSRFAHFGKNSSIQFGFVCAGYENITIGNNVTFGPNCLIFSTLAKVIFNDHIAIGPGVTIVSGDHRVNLIGKTIDEVKDSDKDGTEDKDIHFEGDNWIGANVIILKGVTIGKGSVIGAGSVVTKSIPPYSIAVGNPAKVMKKRFTDEQIREHELIIASQKESKLL